MSAAVAAALVLALPIGFALGALGAGGSILALPVFVYVLGVPAGEAVPMSMALVAATSALAAVLHARRGGFHLRAAGLFALTGAPGAFLGSGLTPLVPQRVLLAIFAGIMLVAGAAMLRARRPGPAGPSCRVLPCLLLGAAVGVLTGFLGVGGGFLIVPALVLLAGVSAPEAVGASLAVITVNALAGLAGQIRQVSFDPTLTLLFVGVSIVGMLAGVAVAGRLPEAALRRAFGGLVVLVALAVAALAAADVAPPG